MSDIPAIEAIDLKYMEWDFDGSLHDVLSPVFESGYRRAIEDVWEDFGKGLRDGEVLGWLEEDLTVNVPLLAGDIEVQVILPKVARKTVEFELSEGNAAEARKYIEKLRALVDELDAICESKKAAVGAEVDG